MPNASPSALRQALRRMLASTGGAESTAANAGMGAILGGMGGLAYSAADGNPSDNVQEAVGIGAGIGAGAGLGRTALRAAGGFARGLREALAERVGRNSTNLFSEQAERSGRAGMRGSEADQMAVGGAQTREEALEYLTQYLSPQELETVARSASNIPEVVRMLRHIGYNDSDFSTWAMNARRFTPGEPRQFTPDELEEFAPRGGSGAGMGGTGMRPDPMGDSRANQAMREQLRQLRRDRSSAGSQEEVDDIDMQIAVLRRDLGLE